MFGFLVVNKPTGMTSRKVVDQIQELIHPIKVGHAGTLDPLAAGVLVLCIGPATRLVAYVQQMPKSYLARFRLGFESETEDSTSPMVAVGDPTDLARHHLEAVLPQFRGTIEQHPPKFSALRIKGRRAYDLARKGRNFDLKPRQIDIHHLALTNFANHEFELEIECGSGTYIRSLGRDIGRALGCGAVMTQLTRTSIGGFLIADGLNWQQVTETSDPARLQNQLVDPISGLQQGGNWPTWILVPEQVENLRHGRQLTCTLPDEMPHEQWLAIDQQQQLLAVMQSASKQSHQPLLRFVNHWNSADTPAHATDSQSDHSP